MISCGWQIYICTEEDIIPPSSLTLSIMPIGAYNKVFGKDSGNYTATSLSADKKLDEINIILVSIITKQDLTLAANQLDIYG